MVCDGVTAVFDCVVCVKCVVACVVHVFCLRVLLCVVVHVFVCVV